MIQLKMHLSLSLVFIIISSSGIYCQESEEKSDLGKEEKILESYFDSLATVRGDKEKERYNQKIIHKFRYLLAQEQTFHYPFDSIQQAGILFSSDNRVKIYNWNLPYDGGYHKYFCFIQYKKGKKDPIKLFELTDQSDKIKNPEDKTLKPDNWYGALYYRIITIEGRDHQRYYTLLGYDPNDFLTNKKVIDVLYFKKGTNPAFGAPIFKNRKVTQRRIIFEYSEFASMTLKYDEGKEMIIYDHLSPSEPKYEGQYEFYGPDFSYDGLKYENGIWNTYFDLDPRLNKIELNN